MMSLKQVGKKNATEIRNGSLLEDDDASQVNLKSWENLAKMNALGFITIDSQDAINTGNSPERSYVSGFMETSKVMNFIHLFNMNTNFLALAIIPGKYNGMFRIPVTVDVGEPITNTPLVLERSDINHLKKEAKVNTLNEDTHLVTCIDMQWKRNANSVNGLFGAVVKQLKK